MRWKENKHRDGKEREADLSVNRIKQKSTLSLCTIIKTRTRKTSLAFSGIFFSFFFFFIRSVLLRESS